MQASAYLHNDIGGSLDTVGTMYNHCVLSYWTPDKNGTTVRTPLDEMNGELWMYLRDHKKLASILIVQEVSHRQLAKAAGYKSHSYVGRLVRGDVRSLEPAAALRIAKFLGLPVDDLFVIKVSSENGRTGQKIAA